MEFIKTQRAKKIGQNLFEMDNTGTTIGIVANDSGINKYIFAEFVADFKSATLKVEHYLCHFNELDQAVNIQLKRKYVDNNQYCNSLGLLVYNSEALNENGTVKNGYYKHFDFWFNTVCMNTNTSIYEALINDIKLDWCGVPYSI